jgi:hypothetical protein
VRVLLRDRAVAAGAAVLATGKWDLRGYRRRHAGPGLLAFKQYWRLDPDQARQLEGHVEIHLFRGGYAGLQPTAHGRVNLCLVATPAAYRRAGGNWQGLLDGIGRDSPLFARRLRHGEPCWPRPLAVAGQPYGFVHRGGAEGRLHRVGDQLAVIHSFCGAGLAIALDSAEAIAARLDGAGPGDGAEYRRPVGLAQITAAAVANPVLARLIVAVAAAAPQGLRWLARHTRVEAH